MLCEDDDVGSSGPLQFMVHFRLATVVFCTPGHGVAGKPQHQQCSTHQSFDIDIPPRQNDLSSTDLPVFGTYFYDFTIPGISLLAWPQISRTWAFWELLSGRIV